ncbi:hypothetical protein [Flavobacterium filum]|uniref:hypothetical protein n=1 Tax=Flavobacterium filum TaxID=370974 RepID=UPI0023F30131|nr:hypothetical protein [Flavobacterium filum]
MEAGKRHIKSGVEFEPYVDRPSGINETIKKNSKLEDTVKFLPQAISRTYLQAERIAPIVVPDYQTNSVYQTCQQLWHWAYKHFQYHKDEKGKEQIRSFRRSFWDRHIGIDCDDFTVVISSLLTIYRIPHILRVAKYTEKQGYQHIYPIVPLEEGGYITMDCVVDTFNYEVPLIQNIDTDMDLQFLDGIDDNNMGDTDITGIDAQDLIEGLEEFGDLSGRKKLFGGGNKSSGGGGGFKQKLNNFKNSKAGQTLKKGIHIANRVNPAAGLLRVGILASLKTNLFKIAEQLRYAYLSPDAASKMNLDMPKYYKVVGVKDKLEKIFFGAGGKTENFKKAILTGRGNRSKEVPLSGLGEVDGTDYNESHHLAQILGLQTYNDEMGDVEGLGSLGEPATGAAIAAATSVMTAIAGLLKSIGSLRKNKTGKTGTESEGGESTDTTTSNESSEQLPSIQTNSISESTNEPELNNSSQSNSTSENNNVNANTNGGANNSNEAETPAESGTPDDTNGSQSAMRKSSSSNSNLAKTNSAASKGTFEKIKEWVNNNKVASGLIAAGVIGLTVWGVSTLMKRNKEKTKQTGGNQNSNGVSGVPHQGQTKHKKRKKSTSKIKYQKLR